MRISSKISLLLLAFVFLGSSTAFAFVDKDKDDDKDKKKQSTVGLSKSQFACNTGSAEVDLEANNVRARIYNNGHLFWKGSGNVYTVPKTGNANSVFASGIWLGGMVGGEMRFAGTDYGPFEFFPGPLDDAGNPPVDCTPYDRIFSITTADMDAFEQGEPHTADIEDWPWQLGAPVVDGDGDPNNYNLAGGDRPELIGDQTVWFVMNDVAGPHGWSQSSPLGLEVQVTAFSFRRADALNNTTFYRYKLIYKGDQQMTNAYFGIWSDPDLGNATDDFVGADTTLGMGFVYNGDGFDDTSVGYGSTPPALGYDYFQGPLVNNDGRDNDEDGVVDEDDERIAMTKFVYYNNDTSVQGNPDTGADAYGYLRGIWKDGQPITEGGTGYGGDTPVDVMFPGDPVAGEYWSEENTDGAGSRNTPADRRFLLSSGPFIMEPGDVQEIVYGIVWARAGDRLASVAKMKADDALAQAAFDVNFQLPSPPDAPQVKVGEYDKTVSLTWNYGPNSNNYLNSYDVANPFLEDVPDSLAPDKSYTFEGYRIYRYASPLQGDLEGELVATFDVPNDVTTVTDTQFDDQTGVPITVVVARGTDSGIRHSIMFENLTNYNEYYYGVQAYAYNEFSAPKILPSPINRVTVTPRKVSTLAGGTDVQEEEIQRRRASADADVVGVRTGSGGGTVTAEIVDPTALTGDTYEVRFYEHCYEVPEDHKTATSDEIDGAKPAESLEKAQVVEECITNYDIINTTTGDKVFDGMQAFEVTHEAAPQDNDVMVIDGLSFSIVGPPPAPATIPGSADIAFLEMFGPGSVDACAPDAASRYGCDEMGGNWVYGSYNSTGEYVMYHNGAGPEETIGAFSPHDFEIRFTEEGGYGEWYFQAPYNGAQVPFEVWDIGPTSTATDAGVNDPSDDVRMIPLLFADSGVDGTCAFDLAEGDDPFGLGWQMSDRIYAYYPTTTYEDWETAVKAVVDAAGGCAPVAAQEGMIDTGPGRPIQRITFNAPAGTDFTGTVVRFLTTKPHLPGDVFEMDTEGLGTERGVAEEVQGGLDAIGIVPNPYKGASNYEVTVTDDVVRFTNLPDQARIQVYTLSGTLVWDEVRGAGNNEWNLTTAEGLPLASGMYIVVVDVENVGKKIIKFGVVKKRIQLDLL